VKLPAIGKRDTASALAKATEDLCAVEGQIAALEQERQSKLLDAEVPELDAIDLKISDLHRQVTVFRDRIVRLEERLADERAGQAKRDYAAWAARVEATMPACRAADEKYERAKTALAAATKEVILSRENALRVYTEGEFPPATVFVAYYLSLEPLGRDILETWTVPRGLADRNRAGSPTEYLTRGCDVGPRGYAPGMRERLDEFILAVKTAHDPVPAETENEEAA
jgi:hypothetical protein